MIKKIDSSKYFTIGNNPSDPVISNSLLSTVNPDQGGNYKKYLDFFAKSEIQKEFFTTGHLVHKYLEAPDLFEVQIEATAPTSPMMLKFLDYLAFREVKDIQNADAEILKLAFDTSGYSEKYGLNRVLKDTENYQDYYSYLLQKNNTNKHVITAKQKEIIIALKQFNETTLSNFLEKQGPFQSHEELVVIDELFGNKCKGMMDRVLIKANGEVVLIDYKTTSKNIHHFTGRTDYHLVNDKDFNVVRLGGSFYNYRYYRQIAFYKKLLAKYLKVDVNIIRSYIVALSTIDPFETKIFDLDADPFTRNLLRIGNAELPELFRLVEQYATLSEEELF